MADEKNDQAPLFIAEDADRAVEAFVRKYNISFDPERIHGIQIAIKGNEPEIEVLTLEPDRVRSLVPEDFTYPLIDEPKKIRVKVRKQEPAKASGVEAGRSAGYINNTAGGTAGWNVFLLNDVMCLSARHAVCDYHNASCIGQDVWLDSNIRGKVFCHQPLDYDDPTKEQVWDMAAVKYNNPADADAKMRPCQEGHDPAAHAYPTVLTPSRLVGPGSATFHIVGNAAPVCQKGKLVAAGVRRLVPFDTGKMVLFAGQLAFEEMSQKGDSGAVIVRSNGDSVTGLVIAHSPPAGGQPGGCAQ
jgi:hypothetical protein